MFLPFFPCLAHGEKQLLNLVRSGFVLLVSERVTISHAPNFGKSYLKKMVEIFYIWPQFICQFTACLTTVKDALK